MLLEMNKKILQLVLKVSLWSLLSIFFIMNVCSCSTNKAQQDSLDIQIIKDRGMFNVGVKYDVPRFAYKGSKDETVEGLEVDIARIIAKKIMGDANKINFQPVSSKTKGPLLDNNEVDFVIATYTITEERKNKYNFSTPYFTDTVALMVNSDSTINTSKDLNRKRIGVSQNSSTRNSLQKAFAKCAISPNFVEFGTYSQIKVALKENRIDAFATDYAILLGYHDSKYRILDERFSAQNYGIATKKTNLGLAKLIDEIIVEMKNTGELQRLLEKWKLI